jgi:hypothetical protein
MPNTAWDLEAEEEYARDRSEEEKEVLRLSFESPDDLIVSPDNYLGFIRFYFTSSTDKIIEG